MAGSSAPCPCCGERLNQGTRGLFLDVRERRVSAWRQAAWKTCSTCSTLAKRHVFLPWPAAFGIEGTRTLNGEEQPENNCSLHRNQKTGENREFDRRECSPSGILAPKVTNVPAAESPVVRPLRGASPLRGDEPAWSDADIAGLVQALVLMPLDEEGYRKLVEHVRLERSPRTRREFLAHRRRDGNLECDACGVHLGKRYGSAFADVVEVHHRVPLWKRVQRSSRDTLALLCPTCHRVVHYKQREPLQVEEVKRLLAPTALGRR